MVKVRSNRLDGLRNQPSVGQQASIGRRNTAGHPQSGIFSRGCICDRCAVVRRTTHGLLDRPCRSLEAAADRGNNPRKAEVRWRDPRGRTAPPLAGARKRIRPTLSIAAFVSCPVRLGGGALNHGFFGFRIEWRVVQTGTIHPTTRATSPMTPTTMMPIRSVYSVSAAPRSSRQRRVSSFFRPTPNKGISSCCPSRSPSQARQPTTPADATSRRSTFVHRRVTRPCHQGHHSADQPGQGQPRKRQAI